MFSTPSLVSLSLSLSPSTKEEAEKLKEQLQTALVQTNARNSSLVSELAMRKNMCSEALKGKQLSDTMVAEAQRDFQSLNARIMELDAEIRVGFGLIF